MNTTKIYGIKNCDTMKKTFKWLETHKISYEFHDYKKQGLDEDVMQAAMKDHGWESVINKRGTTWRQLPKEVQNTMDDTKALATARENPSIIKRPLLMHKNQTHLGFNPDQYKEIFGI